MSFAIRSSVAAALVAVVALAGCGRRSEERYALKGTVVSVDLDAKRVVIKHDAIEGYMDAMTMPFRVGDERMLPALEPGRLVTADLVVSSGESHLENIVVTTAPGLPTLPSRVEGSTEPTPGEPAPAFSLVDENGKPTTLASFKGKAVALTFIYTRCPLPDYCPLMTNNFSRVAGMLALDKRLVAQTQLLSVSIDPEYDTPEVLREYAQRWAADDGRVPENWSFLTGDPASVRSMARRYGLVYETEGGQIVHTLRTAIIGPDGKLIRIYRGNEWKPEEIAKDLSDATRGQVTPF